MEWEGQSFHAEFKQKLTTKVPSSVHSSKRDDANNKDTNTTTMATDIMEMDIDIDLGDMDEDDMEGMEGESNIVDPIVS